MLCKPNPNKSTPRSVLFLLIHCELPTSPILLINSMTTHCTFYLYLNSEAQLRHRGWCQTHLNASPTIRYVLYEATTNVPRYDSPLWQCNVIQHDSIPHNGVFQMKVEDYHGGGRASILDRLASCSFASAYRVESYRAGWARTADSLLFQCHILVWLCWTHSQTHAWETV